MRIRNRRVGTGYQELEYLSTGSSSTAYFKQVYLCTSNYIDIEIVATTTKNNKEMCVCGSGGYLELGYSATTGRLIAYTSGLTTLAYTGKTDIYSNEPHTFHFWQEQNSRNFKFDNYDTLTNSSIATLNGRYINLLTYDSGNESYTLQSGRFYKCIIKDNGVVVRHFVPVKRLLDSKIGIYDLINDAFYTSANTSVFEEGHIVVEAGIGQFQFYTMCPSSKTLVLALV